MFSFLGDITNMVAGELSKHKSLLDNTLAALIPAELNITSPILDRKQTPVVEEDDDVIIIEDEDEDNVEPEIAEIMNSDTSNEDLLEDYLFDDEADAESVLSEANDHQEEEKKMVEEDLNRSIHESDHKFEEDEEEKYEPEQAADPIKSAMDTTSSFILNGANVIRNAVSNMSNSFNVDKQNNSLRDAVSTMSSNISSSFGVDPHNTFLQHFREEIKNVMRKKEVRVEEKAGCVQVYEYEDSEDRGLAECQLCSKSVKVLRVAVLLRHICSHNKEAKQWQCGQCGYSEHDIMPVKKHIKASHNSEERPVNRRVTTDIDALYLSMTRKCFPEHYGRVKKYAAELKKRSKKESRTCTQKEKAALKCLLCCKEIRDVLTALHSHLGHHCQEKQFKCATCSSEFSNRCHVKVHIQNKHDGKGEIILRQNDKLDSAWMRAASQCFPTRAVKLNAHIIRNKEKRELVEKMIGIVNGQNSTLGTTTQMMSFASDMLMNSTRMTHSDHQSRLNGTSNSTMTGDVSRRAQTPMDFNPKNYRNHPMFADSHLEVQCRDREHAEGPTFDK